MQIERLFLLEYFSYILRQGRHATTHVQGCSGGYAMRWGWYLTLTKILFTPLCISKGSQRINFSCFSCFKKIFRNQFWKSQDPLKGKYQILTYSFGEEWLWILGVPALTARRGPVTLQGSRRRLLANLESSDNIPNLQRKTQFRIGSINRSGSDPTNKCHFFILYQNLFFWSVFDQNIRSRSAMYIYSIS